MKIACVLISHLPAKAEQRRHPDLRRRPIIITEESRGKRVVLDSSPEAAGVSAQVALSENPRSTLEIGTHVRYHAYHLSQIQSSEVVV